MRTKRSRFIKLIGQTEMTQFKRSIGIIGDGGWGTTLAKLLAEKGYPVMLWGPFADNIRQMERSRENKKFLPGIKLPKSIQLTSSLDELIAKNNYLVLAIPSQYLDSILGDIKKRSYRGKVFVSVVKGI